MACRALGMLLSFVLPDQLLFGEHQPVHPVRSVVSTSTNWELHCTAPIHVSGLLGEYALELVFSLTSLYISAQHSVQVIDMHSSALDMLVSLYDQILHVRIGRHGFIDDAILSPCRSTRLSEGHHTPGGLSVQPLWR